MSPHPLPPMAAWQHRWARTGFEVAHFDTRSNIAVAQSAMGDAVRIEGCTTAVEGGHAWIVDYLVVLDAGWVTRRVEVRSRSSFGSRHVRLEIQGDMTWLVNGQPAPSLSGCLDVDLESSALTNAFPIHRLLLGVGDHAAAPAAYVRALDCSVDRLDQHYTRLADGQDGQRFHYTAPAFDFACDITYDRAGLIIEYPGLASRAI